MQCLNGFMRLPGVSKGNNVKGLVQHMLRKMKKSLKRYLPARLGRTLPLLCLVECHTKTSRMILLEEEFGLPSPIERCVYRGCYQRVPNSEISNRRISTLLVPGKVILSAVYVAIALGMVTMLYPPTTTSYPWYTTKARWRWSRSIRWLDTT